MAHQETQVKRELAKNHPEITKATPPNNSGARGSINFFSGEHPRGLPLSPSRLSKREESGTSLASRLAQLKKIVLQNTVREIGEKVSVRERN